ncbi:conserved protein, unknown function, partial [Hepatocystis sp. ex Piliocolobus tephrosceles]
TTDKTITDKTTTDKTTTDKTTTDKTTTDKTITDKTTTDKTTTDKTITDKTTTDKTTTDKTITDKTITDKTTTDKKTTDKKTTDKKTTDKTITDKNALLMNETLFNKILNTFISELKTFFFSIIAKVKSSELVAKLIISFSELCLLITPDYVNTINFIEILSEFSNVIPIKYIDKFIMFFEKNKNDFILKYKQFINSVIFNEPIKIQSIGARLIGLIKILQNKHNSSNQNKTKSRHIFFLHLLLSECLPIHHLGFCNRQSIKNNINFFFYDTLQRHEAYQNDQTIFYNKLELSIQENITNLKKVKNIIQDEFNEVLQSHIIPPVMLSSLEDATIDSNKTENYHTSSYLSKNKVEQKEKESINNHLNGDITNTTNNYSDSDTNSEKEKYNNKQKKKQKNNSASEKTKEVLDANTITNKKKNFKRNRDCVSNSVNEEEDIYNDRYIIKKPKLFNNNELYVNFNEKNKNYNVYLAYVYLILFIKFPDVFITTNCSDLKEIYKAFQLFYLYTKNMNKKNITCIKDISEYLYNADIDFIANIHIYNIAIQDKQFLKVFMFNILLSLQYLSNELDTLIEKVNLNEQTNQEEQYIKKKGNVTTSDIKNKEMAYSATQNNIPLSTSSNINDYHLSKTNRVNPEQNTTYNNTSTSKINIKNKKENIRQDRDSNTNRDDTNVVVDSKGKANTNSNVHNSNVHNSNVHNSNVHNSNVQNSNVQNSNNSSSSSNLMKNKDRGIIKTDINEKTKNNNQHNSTNLNELDNKNNESLNIKIKKIINLFIKDVMNYLDYFEDIDYFKQLIYTEHCWDTWKKQLTIKSTKENNYTNFEFKSHQEQTNRSTIHNNINTNKIIHIKNKNNKCQEHKKKTQNKSLSPILNLIEFVNCFEILNNNMTQYYNYNENNKNLTKYKYKYTKIVARDDTNMLEKPMGATNMTSTTTTTRNYNQGNKTCDKLNQINNFLLEINKIYLRREAEYWELDENDSITSEKKCENEKKILIEKLIDKLEDYKKKMNIDNDPINEIEESEKSKNNAVFKFRLSKLFSLKYIDLYSIIKYKEFSADCDFLYNLMVKMDKNLDQKKKIIVIENEETAESEAVPRTDDKRKKE